MAYQPRFGGAQPNPLMNTVVRPSMPGPVGGSEMPAPTPANTASSGKSGEDKRSVAVKALDVGYEVKHTGGEKDGQTHAAPSHFAMHKMIADHFGHQMGTEQ